MNAQVLAQSGLRLRLWLVRCGWINIAAALLLASGGVAWLWVMPHLEQQVQAGRAALAAAQKSLASAPAVPAAPPVPPAQQHLQQFTDLLGQSRYAEQQVKTLFAIAARNGLTLSKAEYKFGASKDGGFHTYTVSLPVKGPYGAIRPFCEQVLLAIPFASLDEVNAKRETVNSTGLDVKLRFTLFLDHGGGIASSGEDVGEHDLQEKEP